MNKASTILVSVCFYIYTICQLQGAVPSNKSGKLSAQTVPLIFDTNVTGVVATPAEQDRFTFSGTAGQRLYYDTLKVDQRSLFVELITPSGASMWYGNHFANKGPFYLTESGTYTLIVDGYGDAGDYAFQLKDASQAAKMNTGSTLTGQLNPMSETDLYQFNGTAGQRFKLESISTSTNSAKWRVVGPASQELAANFIDQNLGEIVLPATGIYLVLIEGTAEDTAKLDYQIRLSLVSNPSGSASGFGTVQSGAIDAGKEAVFNYSAPAGTVTLLDGLAAAASLAVQYLDPEGNHFLTSNPGQDQGLVILPVSGAYKLRVVGSDSSSSGNFQFRWLNLAADSKPLTIGSTVTGSLDPGLKTEVYRFTGTPGQRLIFDAIDGNNGALGVRLISPSGVDLVYKAYEEIYPTTLVEPGAYYLCIEGRNEANPANYTFRLLDISQSPVNALALNTDISGVLNPGRKTEVYRFSGNAGDKVFFNAKETAISGAWRLFGPNNQELKYSNLGSDDEIILPQTGAYVLTFEGSSDAETPYAMSVVSSSITNMPLTLGAATSGAIVRSGDEHRYVFSGMAGQRLYYDAITNEINFLSVRLFDSQKNRIAMGGDSDVDVAPFTLPASGTYTLTIGGQYDGVGGYAFRLIDVTQSPAQALTLNQSLSQTLENRFYAAIFRFNATNGQRFFLDNQGVNNAGSWYAYGPNDQSLGYSGIVNDFEFVAVEVGTYLIIVTDSTADALSFTFKLITPLTSRQSLTFGNILTQTFGNPGDENEFNFAGATGQRIYYDGLDDDQDNVTVLLRSPSGRSVGEINGNTDYNYGPVTLLETGVYTLVFHNSTEKQTDYKFQLLDVSAQPALVSGTSANKQLNPQSQTHLYRFEGGVGQLLTVDFLSPSATTPTWSILSPNNQNLILRDFTVTHEEGIPLPESGTYVLMIAGNGPNSETVDYGVRLSLSTQATQPNTGFNTFTGALSAGSEESLTFSASAGLRIYLDQLNFNASASYTLTDPDNIDLPTFNPSWVDFGPYTLLKTGAYKLKVKGLADGSYNFRLLDLASSTSITIGTVYEGALDTPYQSIVYSFKGVPGQRLIYDSLDSSPSTYSAIFRVVSPSGQVIIGGYSTWTGGFYYPIGADSAAFTLAEKGTYYISFENMGLDSVPLKFRLLDISKAPSQTLTLDTPITVQLDPKRAQAFSFALGAAQRLFFDNLDTNALEGNWVIYDNLNQYVAYNSINNDIEPTIVQAGTNVIVLANNSLEAITCHFRVVTPMDYSTPLTLGSPVQGVLAEPGEIRNFTFSATNGQQLYFDTMVSASASVSVLLIYPSGEIFNWANFNQDAGPLNLTETGNYALRLHNHMDKPVNYNFRILDIQSQPALEIEKAKQISMNPGTSAAIYRFQGIAGLRMFFQNIQSSSLYNYWQIVGPSGAVILNNDSRNSFEFTPTISAEHLLVFTSDTETSATDSNFEVVVGNHAPALGTLANTVITEMTAATLALSATDKEQPNDMLTYSLMPGAPEGLSIDSRSGSLTWNPTEAQGPNTFSFGVRVADDGPPSMSSTQSYSLTVQEFNRPPALTVPSDQTVNEGSPLKVKASATDPDLPANSLSFRLLNPPAGAAIDPVSGEINWIPTESQGPSTYTLTVVVTDNNPPAINDKQLSATNSFKVIVNEMNQPPVWNGLGLQTIDELSTLIVSNLVSDADMPANTFTYTLMSGPAGATLDPVTGILSWTPREDQGPSTNTITVSVVDYNENAVNEKRLGITNAFVVVVKEVNLAPSLTALANEEIDEMKPVTLTAKATDPDLPANQLVFSVISGPTGLSIDPSSGSIQWNPTEAQGPTTNVVTIRVADNGVPSLNATQSFTIVVREVNQPPTLTTISDKTIDEMTNWTLNLAAGDPDIPANNVSYNLISAPEGMFIEPRQGVIQWTPTETQGPSTNRITIQVSDDGVPSLSTTQSFTVVVREINLPPGVSTAAPQTVDELKMWTYNVAATDLDIPANSLNYRLKTAPIGVSIDSRQGIVQWTPTEDQGPAVTNIVVEITDDGSPSQSITQTIPITVNEINSAPVIDPIASQTMAAGGTLRFTVTAKDADIPVQALAWKLVDPLPAGAVIQESTGVITWTPTLTVAVPSTNTFTLTVTDNGQPALSDTKSFTVVLMAAGSEIKILSVSRPASGSVTIKWTAAAGSVYQVQYKTNLTESVWQNLPDNVTASGSTAEKTDTISGAARRFYRIQQVQ